MAHFCTSEKSGKIDKLQKIAISKPFDQIDQTLWHQLEQRLIFLFKLVRILKKDTNFRENFIIFHSGRTVRHKQATVKVLDYIYWLHQRYQN